MDEYPENSKSAELENSNVQQLWGNDYAPQIIYKPKRRKRIWLWVTLAAILVCAAVVSAVVFTGGPEKREIKGNSGIVALYDFFQYQKDNQSALQSGLYKDLNKTLESGPFDIESEIKVSSDSFSKMGIPFDNITLGLDAKYDMKDFGLKVSALGIDFVGAYLIGDNVVVELGGNAGSLELTGSKGLDRSMPISERLKAVLPFLPDDDLYTDLIEKVSLSIPDSTVSKDFEDIYSPKEDKKVKMNVITVKIDAAALKQIAQKFSDSLKEDKALSGKLQNVIDEFTGFAGLGPEDLSGLLSKLVDLSGSDDLKDIDVTICVYQKEGIYTGVSINFSKGDTKSSFTFMNEFSGKEEYLSDDININGNESGSYYKYTWQDNEVRISGRVTESTGGSADSSTMLLSGTMDLSKSSQNDYKLSGSMTLDGEIYSEYEESNQNKITLDFGIDADIKTGGGLGTLKETSGWDGVYNKNWSDLKDMINNLLKSYGLGSEFSLPGQEGA